MVISSMKKEYIANIILYFLLIVFTTFFLALNFNYFSIIILVILFITQIFLLNNNRRNNFKLRFYCDKYLTVFNFSEENLDLTKKVRKYLTNLNTYKKENTNNKIKRVFLVIHLMWLLISLNTIFVFNINIENYFVLTNILSTISIMLIFFTIQIISWQRNNSFLRNIQKKLKSYDPSSFDNQFQTNINCKQYYSYDVSYNPFDNKIEMYLSATISALVVLGWTLKINNQFNNKNILLALLYFTGFLFLQGFKLLRLYYQIKFSKSLKDQIIDVKNIISIENMEYNDFIKIELAKDTFKLVNKKFNIRINILGKSFFYENNNQVKDFFKAKNEINIPFYIFTKEDILNIIFNKKYKIDYFSSELDSKMYNLDIIPSAFSKQGLKIFHKTLRDSVYSIELIPAITELAYRGNILEDILDKTTINFLNYKCTKRQGFRRE